MAQRNSAERDVPVCFFNASKRAISLLLSVILTGLSRSEAAGLGCFISIDNDFPLIMIFMLFSVVFWVVV